MDLATEQHVSWQALSAMSAAALVLTATVLWFSQSPAASAHRDPFTGAAMARMSPPNALGDAVFKCNTSDCNPNAGMVGLHTRLAYASTRDAILGQPIYLKR